MQEQLLSRIYELKEKLEIAEKSVRLKEKETRMENDDEVMRLAFHFDQAQQLYNDVLKHFPMASNEAQEKQKALYLAKKDLDEHILVQDYLQAYKTIRQLYAQIQQEIFTPFNHHDCNEKR